MTSPSDPPWVFGYGSLIWNPGFPFIHAERALVRGLHRSLCIVSHIHRGTPERPGLVFGLERGGSCVGLAFKVAPEAWMEVRDYLRAREQITNVYKETHRNARLASGETVRALIYVADATHEQFAGDMSEDQQLEIVRGAKGQSGHNAEYVINTTRHLTQMGIIDHRLIALSERLESDIGM